MCWFALTSAARVLETPRWQFTAFSALLHSPTWWSRVTHRVIKTLNGLNPRFRYLLVFDILSYTQMLESDMLIAQSLVASRYTHFKKESLEWQRSLSFVSDVMTMLNGIQVSSSSDTQ